jgi:uncharacterized delta-60 repeat protein
MAGYDLTFDGDGRATTDLGGLRDQIQELIPLANGQILVAGEDDSQTLVIVRYNSDGSLDNSFGTAGKLDTGILGASIYSLANGNIIVSGRVGNNSIISKYLPDGKIDLSFGANGRYSSSTSIPLTIPRLNPIDGSEEIFIGTFTSTPEGNLVINIKALDAQGRDKSFTLNGINILNTLSLDAGIFNKIISSPVVDRADPKIQFFYNLLGESVINEFRARFTIANFSIDGIVPIPLSDGSILTEFLQIKSFNVSPIFETRFNADPNVTIDTNFGTNGLATFPQNIGTITVIDKLDRFIFAFYDRSTAKISVQRFTKNGIPDLTFGNNGTIELSAPSPSIDPLNSLGLAISIDSQNRVIITTKLRLENTIDVARIDDKGIVDNTFGTNGKLQLPSTISTEVSRETVKLGADDRLFLSGSTFVSSNNQDIVVSKYDLTNPLNVSVRNDFNGDGTSDILWRNNDGSIATWQMIGYTVTPKSVGSLTADWKIAGTGDFNGDSKADILWRNNDGRVTTWQMNGSNINSSVTFGTATADWKTAGTGDFNGDGKTDILWRNDNGTVALWQMNGATVAATAFVGTLTTDWQIAGTADFNGDGKVDILLSNTDGSVALWQIDSSSIIKASSVGKLTNGWSIAGTADFNGDGKADILLRNTNGSVAEWQMNGSTVTATATVGSATSDWKISGTGDFDGDGKADILWRNDNGGVAEWRMNGANVISAGSTSIPSSATSWNIAAPIL